MYVARQRGSGGIRLLWRQLDHGSELQAFFLSLKVRIMSKRQRFAGLVVDYGLQLWRYFHDFGDIGTLSEEYFKGKLLRCDRI